MLHTVHTLIHLHMHVQTHTHSIPILLCCFVLHSKSVLPKQTTKITVTTTHPRQCPQSRHITEAQGLSRKFEGVSFRMRSFHRASLSRTNARSTPRLRVCSSNDRLAPLEGFTGHYGIVLAPLSFSSLHTVYKCMINMTNRTGIKERE